MHQEADWKHHRCNCELEEPHAGRSKPVIHVVFGMSAAGILRQMGLDQPVVGLPDDLSFGPIDRPFRVVDITHFQFATRIGRPGPKTWITPTFGHIDHDRIIDAQLIDRQAVLEERQIEAYRKMWGQLRAENAPFRVAHDQGLSSAPITHFDNDIEYCVTGEWQNCSRVVSETIGKLLDDRFAQCGDMVLWSRVRTLAAEGVLEMKGDGEVMRKSFVRLPS